MRSSKLNYLLLLLLITLLCIGGVEAFYAIVDKKFSSDPSATDTATPAMTPETGAGRAAVSVAAEPAGEPDIAAITRRNLFASQAAPIEKPPTDPLEGLAPSSLAIVLMGTVTGDEEERRAIIYDRKTRKQELYQVGDFVQQASIKDIYRGKVIITYNGTDEMLDIADARDVNVPQVRPVPRPSTTATRVVPRPVGSSTRLVPARSPKPRVVPAPRSARQLRTAKGSVIVKGRTTNSTNNN